MISGWSEGTNIFPIRAVVYPNFTFCYAGFHAVFSEN